MREPPVTASFPTAPLSRLRAWVPGVIAGAADADPTTVVAITIVGAATGFGLSWLVVLLFPLLAVVQVIAARLGLVSGRDLQSVVRHTYGPPAQLLLLVSLVVVNVLTIAADLEGGAAALGLLTGIDWRWFVVPLAVFVVALLLLGAYGTVQRFLLCALACLGAYVLAAFLAHPDWGRVAIDTVRPTLHFDSTWMGGALAILGTTLTAYVFVWLTIEESEDASPLSAMNEKSRGAWGGTLVSVVVFWFILQATGATLGQHHSPVRTVQQAAAALRPLAGGASADLFGVGLLASALVALPVIAITSAYVVGAQFRWQVGLSLALRDAPRFYAVVIAGVATATIVAFAGLSPVHVLYVASIGGGLATPIGLVVLVSAASRRDVMGERRVAGVLLGAGWAVIVVITALDCAYLAQQAIR